MNERNLAPLSNDLSALKKDAEELASNWNGKDEKFMYDGSIYNEEDAGIASDIAEKCGELIELFEGIIN